MSDYRRVKFLGGVFFFTVVTHDRAPLFTSDERIEVLRAAFRRVKAARPSEWPWGSFGRAVARGWYEPSWGAVAPTEVLRMELE